MEKVQIPDTLYVRDVHSKAILNIDKKGLNDYLIKKEIVKKQREEQNQIKERLEKIEQDMQEIKELITKMRP